MKNEKKKNKEKKEQKETEKFLRNKAFAGQMFNFQFEIYKCVEMQLC